MTDREHPLRAGFRRVGSGQRLHLSGVNTAGSHPPRRPGLSLRDILILGHHPIAFPAGSTARGLAPDRNKPHGRAKAARGKRAGRERKPRKILRNRPANRRCISTDHHFPRGSRETGSELSSMILRFTAVGASKTSRRFARAAKSARGLFRRLRLKDAVRLRRLRLFVFPGAAAWHKHAPDPARHRRLTGRQIIDQFVALGYI
jgi:hypothetical protein